MAMSDFLRRAKYLLSETEASALESARAEVAFVGRSNVGKSSFLNALCQTDIARVSKTPGRTRMINVFAVDYLRWLVDLPGYGYAVGPVESREGWSAMIEGYLMNRPSLRMLYMLVDCKVGPTKLDHQMREWLMSQNLPYTIVGNKIDQVKPSQRHAQQKKIAADLHLPMDQMRWISATEGTGIAPLRQEIVKLLQSDNA